MSQIDNTGKELEVFDDAYISSLNDESLVQYIERLSQNAKENNKVLDEVKKTDSSNVIEKHMESPLEVKEEPIFGLDSNKKDHNVEANKNSYYGRGQYFRDKELKQYQQDQKLLQENKDKIKLFKNCVIYINGYTNPDRMVLHKIIVIHGGKFLHHLSSKGKVTHIIATNLPLKKRIEFANYKVVTPNWVLDSVKEEKLLPWQDYSLLNNNSNEQHRLNLVNLKDKVDHGNNMNINCNDPEFVESYFKNSRLHHLSTWKSDLRARFLKDFTDSNNFQAKVPKLTDHIKIFHIDFDSFFATVATLVANRDENLNIDIDKDVILVCHGSNNSDIASCNYAARQLGIKNGMWVSHAKKLCPSGVKWICLPYNFEEFEIASQTLYRCLNNSGLFDLVLPVSIDEAICVMVNRNYSTEELSESCENLRNTINIQTMGCRISVGCANSLILARLALRLAKPDGYHIIDDNEFLNNPLDRNLNFWSQFKINDLPGVGYSIVQKLTDYFNLRKDAPVADLIKVSNKETIKICTGIKVGEKLNLSFEGKDDEESRRIIFDPIELFQRKTLSMEINWGIRFKNIQQVDVFIGRCAEYLLQKLVSLNKSVSQVTLKIMKRADGAPIDPPKYMGMGRCDAFSRSSRFALPTNDLGTIATELKNLFRTLTCPPTELRGVFVQFTKLVDPYDQAQTRLPFKKVIPMQTLDNLPNRLKLKFEDEICKRNIIIEKENKSPIFKSLIPKNLPKKYSPTKQEEEFLRELPTQIRTEVTHGLVIDKKVQDSKLEALHTRIQKKRNLLESNRNHFLGDKSIFRPISFQGQTSFKNISKLIREWVCTTLQDNGPHKKDVKLFKKYLVKLCDSNRVFLVLQLTEMVSRILTLSNGNNKKLDGSISNGYLDWERILLQDMISILNRNKKTFQEERNLDFEFDV